MGKRIGLGTDAHEVKLKSLKTAKVSRSVKA